MSELNPASREPQASFGAPPIIFATMAARIQGPDAGPWEAVHPDPEPARGNGEDPCPAYFPTDDFPRVAEAPLAATSFDRRAVESHVSLLHDLAEGLDGFLILAAFEAGGQAQVQRFRIGDVDGMVETIMGFENHPSANLYTPWSIMRRDLEPRKKGSEGDVVAVLAAVGDLDNDKYSLGELPIEAPYIVETSPGNFQPVYIFERPLAAADAKPVLAALSDFIGGDSGTKDCSHVWRIPGTLNIPTKSKLVRGRPSIPASVAIKKAFDGRFTSPATLLALAPPPRRPNGHDTAPSGSLTYTEESRLRGALAVIPAEDRDTWLKVGAALHLFGARATWDDWSKTSGKFDAADQDRVWASFHGERKEGVITVATIYAWAKERGWVSSVNAHEPLCREQKARKITATPYVWQDPKTIPRREFLYGKFYIRKFISTVVAAGGIGKSSLALVEAIAMATGRSLLGVPVPKRLRVWYWNGEDPKDETERRIAAILLHFKIAPEEIEGWLFTDSGRETPICIAEPHKDGVIFGPDAKALSDEITAKRIDVFILDPFVKTHGVSENINVAIDRVARKYADIADEANCAIGLAHHVRKASGNGRAEITIDDARGAGSLVDAARSNRVLNVMTTDEATAAQVKPEQRKSYFRADDGKANMAPPAENTTWFKIVSIGLGNHEVFELGDFVGVVTSWQLPGVFVGVTTEDLPKVQAAIERGSWAKNAGADDWAGKAIAKALEIDLDDTGAKERIARLLKAWLKSKALVESDLPDPKRPSRNRPTIIVGVRAT